MCCQLAVHANWWQRIDLSLNVDPYETEAAFPGQPGPSRQIWPSASLEKVPLI